MEVLRKTLGDAAPEVARLVPDLRRLMPDIPPAIELPPAQQRHYLFKSVAEFLERMSRTSSVVLLLDDLQWADNATLLLLQHLVPLLGQLPVLALGTYRNVELDVNRPFAATLETLNPKRLAQRLHLTVADAIERAAGSAVERHASDLAHHQFQAGTAADSGKTVRFLTLAGDQALSAGAFDEALRRFTAALSLIDEDDQPQIGDLRSKKGRALQSLGRWEEAIDEWKRALSIYEELGDRPAMATVCVEMAYLLIWTAQGTEAAGVARLGLDGLGPEASTDRCLLLAIGGWVSRPSGLMRCWPPMGCFPNRSPWPRCLETRAPMALRSIQPPTIIGSACGVPNRPTRP